MKTYIATSLTRLDDQRRLASVLAELGAVQTFDWTRQGTLSGRPPEDVAWDEIAALADLDFMVLLLPCGRGAHVEMGAALMAGTTVFLHAANESVLLGADGYTCVFYHHPDVVRVFGDMDVLVSTIRDWITEDHYG